MVRVHFGPPLLQKKMKIWGFSSAGRAPALQAGGQRFDPANLHHILKRLTEVPTKVEASLNFFKEFICTLKTEHWNIIDAILWEGNSKGKLLINKLIQKGNKYNFVKNFFYESA